MTEWRANQMELCESSLSFLSVGVDKTVVQGMPIAFVDSKTWEERQNPSIGYLFSILSACLQAKTETTYFLQMGM
jgi:hypothetical protein